MKDGGAWDAGLTLPREGEEKDPLRLARCAGEPPIAERRRGDEGAARRELPRELMFNPHIRDRQAPDAVGLF